MITRVMRIIAFLIWMLILTTIIIPIIIYIITGVDWVEDGIEYIDKRY